MFKRQKVAGARADDFILWVPPISRRLPDWEEEEEEDGMSDLIHNFAAWKWKQDASLEQAADAIPEVVGESDNPRLDEGSEVRAIIISSSSEMGLNEQPTPKNVTLAESNEVFPAPSTI